MLSQVVAMTGPGGLPTLPPSRPEFPELPELPQSAQQSWNMHMPIKEEADSTTATAQPDDVAYHDPFSSTTDADRQAVSNLLEALKTAQPMDMDPASQAQISNQLPNLQAGDLDLMDNGVEGLHPDDAKTLADFQQDLSAFEALASQDPALASLSIPPSFPLAYLPDQDEAFADNALALPPPPPLALAATTAPPALAPPTLATDLPAPTPERREVEAFAKIEFEDGNYYITTWQCELGRDALAFKAARERAEAAKKAKEGQQGQARSSSGKLSRPPDRIRRQEESQVQGSVVSDAGGFGGIDEAPVNEPKSDAHPSQSSQISSSDVVRPQEVLYHPPTVPFDYNRNAELQARALEPDNEEPAPVTAEHMPDANQCPIIPIHAMAGGAPQDEVDTHRGISRRHVRIEWDFESECFKLRVLGRNGCFVDGDWIDPGTSRKLTSGCRIQISSVQMTFRLPRPKTEPLSEASVEGDEENNALAAPGTASPISNDASETPAPSRTKITLTHTGGDASSPPLGPDGQPIVRRRGPGRPPKDGQMSQRERRERAKAAALAEAKAANGGKTPPSMVARKPVSIPEPPKVDAKLDKRKYQKRKREEDGDVLPSIEGGEEEVPDANDTPVQKKARASKSPSPEYPPYASLTEEQLQRPNDPYAKLIYDLLLEIHPKALPLKGIYRMIKMRYPFFVYRVESDGWQSSVRHNLNQEWNKLFEKGDKEGKGFAWRAIPGAIHPQTERKRAAPAPPASKLKPPPPPQHDRNPPHPNQHPLQTLNWQNNPQYSASYWPQGGQPGLHTPPNGLASLQGSALQSPALAQPGSSFPRAVGSGAGAGAGVGAGAAGNNSLSSSTPQLQTLNGAPSFSEQTPLLSLSTEPRVPGTAAPNMPCTLEGIMLMRRFEESMYEQIREGANPQSLEYWQQAFGSARKRLLHGQPKSSLPSGETQEELVIMDYLKAIRDRFCNINFVGFGERKTTPTPPVSVSVSAGAGAPGPGSGSGLTPEPKSSTSASNTQDVGTNPTRVGAANNNSSNPATTTTADPNSEQAGGAATVKDEPDQKDENHDGSAAGAGADLSNQVEE